MKKAEYGNSNGGKSCSYTTVPQVHRNGQSGRRTEVVDKGQHLITMLEY